MSKGHFTPEDLLNPSTSSGGLTAVVQDPGPRLGGDLDCATNDIKNTNLLEINTLSIKNGLTDTIHPGSGNFHNIVQNNGNYFNDPALTHTDLNNQYFFPNGQQILYYKKLPVINEVVVAKCRDGAGQPIVVGGFRGSNFGALQAFFDRIIYDPLGCRCAKIGTAYTRICVRPHLDNCMWKFEVKYDIDFNAKNIDNRFRCFVEHFRGGVLLRSYTIVDITTNGITSIGSSNQTINGGGLAEDVLINDEFYFKIECHATSPEPIAICRFVHWTIYATPRV